MRLKDGSPHAPSSGVSWIGVRHIVQEEVQSLVTTNITGALIKELQEQMVSARVQQQETVAEWQSVVREIQQAMISQQTLHGQLELQMLDSNRSQPDHETAITILAGEAYGSFGNFKHMQQNQRTKQEVAQQIHHQQVQAAIELQQERVYNASRRHREEGGGAINHLVKIGRHHRHLLRLAWITVDWVARRRAWSPHR